jgi:Ca2+-transporting ATPase
MADVLEGVSVVAVIALNAAIGFVSEYRANRAMEALQKLGAAEALVVRSGKRRTIRSTEVVPGDILVVQEGEAIPADGRVVESAQLQVAEASLTGEPEPVEKSPDALDDEDVPLAERANMVYRGTNVTAGNGVAIVVETGMATEIGHVSELVTGIEDVESPLESRLNELGRRLIVLCLAVAVVVALSGILQGVKFGLMLEAAIALAVAAVPEGLPAVATITLAVGMQKMARRKALVRRLPAVETLGSATCVCTDKTGTLTRGEMTVTRLWVPDRYLDVTGAGYSPGGEFAEEGHPIAPEADAQLRGLLLVASLCNNASVVQDEQGGWNAAGDPTEAALIVAAAKAGLHADELRGRHEELHEFAFSSDAMMMGTVNADLGEDLRPGVGSVLCVKGAPDVVLERCTRLLGPGGVSALTDEERRRARQSDSAMADIGLRVLGFAFKPVGQVPEGPDDAYRDLTWLGLAGIMDPPREDARQTVDILTEAGVKTVMITGDQPATAARIAAQLHIAPEGAPVLTGRDLAHMEPQELTDRLDQVEVFARVSPKQKVDILAALRGRGEICAMLGDGVNDAVALKGADIGVAMGVKGTDVAKETADMLLLDDRFATVAAAMQQGRIIYSNISKFIHYLFSCNLSEICTMLLASLLGHPLPLLPLQILWLNIVTDVFPALSLAMEPGEADVMKRPPRSPDSSILDRATVRGIIGYGLLITLATLAAFLVGRRLHGPAVEGKVDPAVTMSFMTIALAQLFHVFNSRKERGPVRGREWWSNPFVLAAIGLTIGLQLAAVYLPGLRTVLRTASPGGVDWLVIVGCSVLPLVVGQTVRWLGVARGASPVA